MAAQSSLLVVVAAIHRFADALFCAFVLSKLDYCNYLLSGSPEHLDELKKVRNSAASLVFKARNPFLKKRRWLPIASRSKHKNPTLCYNYVPERLSL